MKKELKEEFAGCFIYAYNSYQTNTRFPLSIYATLDENGEIESFDTIPTVHVKSLDENDIVVDDFDGGNNIGEWDFNEDGTLADNDGHLLDDMVDALDGWGTFDAVEDKIEEAMED
jgi:hypothetical protein